MRVSCPSCGATYEIPDNVLAAGRRLRCAKCAQEWTPPLPAPGGTVTGIAAGPPPEPPRIPPPPEPFDGVDIPPPPPLVAPPPLVEPRDRRRTRPAIVGTAWLASIAAIVLVAAAAYYFRDEVQAGWPPSRVVYAALGLV